MTPLDVIKKGIANNNMEMVSKGFAQLTGEVVDPPDGEDVEEDNVVSDEVTSSEPRAGDSFIAPSKSDDPQEGKKRIARMESIVVKENQFVDDGEEAGDITTPEYTPSPRTRNPAKTVEVKCHLCGSETIVNEMLVSGDFYRCDNCVTRK